MQVCCQFNTALKFYCLHRIRTYISINSWVVNPYWLHTCGLVFCSISIKCFDKSASHEQAATMTCANEWVCLFFRGKTNTDSYMAINICFEEPRMEHSRAFNLDYFAEVRWTIDNWIDSFALQHSTHSVGLCVMVRQQKAKNGESNKLVFFTLSLCKRANAFTSYL